MHTVEEEYEGKIATVRNEHNKTQQYLEDTIQKSAAEKAYLEHENAMLRDELHDEKCRHEQTRTELGTEITGLKVCMSVCVCVYVYIYICICTCIILYAYTHMYM
jgi:hypothetical protein